MNTNDYTLIEHLNEKFDLIYDPKSNNKILVRVTSLHLKGLNILLDPNNTYYTRSFNINGENIVFPIISIFNCKNHEDNERDSANNENVFDFDTPYSKKLLLDRFKSILGSVFKNNDNATVLMPHKNNITRLNGVLVSSYNELNTYIQQAINEVNQTITFISKLLRKLDIDEISEICYPPGSYFHHYFRIKYNYTDEECENMFIELFSYLNRMPNGKYKKYLIKNEDIIDAVGLTMEMSYEWMSASYRENITGKDILLVDDTITYGQTLQEMLNIIYDTYTPKSVTILTMFSKKFDE